MYIGYWTLNKYYYYLLLLSLGTLQLSSFSLSMLFLQTDATTVPGDCSLSVLADQRCCLQSEQKEDSLTAAGEGHYSVDKCVLV